jgi:hypothetical protein
MADPSQLDELPLSVNVAAAILEPEHQALLLDRLASDMQERFDAGQPDLGFYNPNTDTRVELPFGQPVVVHRLPNYFSPIRKDSKSFDTVEGTLSYARLQPNRREPNTRNLQTAGQLSIGKDRRFGAHDTYTVGRLIDRRYYSAMVTLDFGEK